MPIRRPARPLPRPDRPESSCARLDLTSPVLGLARPPPCSAWPDLPRARPGPTSPVLGLTLSARPLHVLAAGGAEKGAQF
eukprot:361530-Chlamydomonas_euryale.AAC.2